MAGSTSKPYEIERALLHPADVFHHPLEVLEYVDLSRSFKLKILQSWRLDAHKELTDSSRGDVPDVSEYAVLMDINEALLSLDGY